MAGLLTKSDGKRVMLWRIAGWGKKIYPMLRTSCKPISLGIWFDSFSLLLMSDASGTSRSLPWTFLGPLYDSVCYSWGMFLASWASPHGMRVFFCCCNSIMPIQTRMSHPLSVGHFGGRECKGCCLCSLCNISNILICITPQQHYSTSPLHEQSHIAKVLGEILL